MVTCCKEIGKGSRPGRKKSMYKGPVVGGRRSQEKKEKICGTVTGSIVGSGMRGIGRQARPDAKILVFILKVIGSL